MSNLNEDFILECYGDMFKSVVKEGNLNQFLEHQTPEFKEACKVALYSENMSFLLNEGLKDKFIHNSNKMDGTVDNFIGKASNLLRKVLIGNTRDDIIENRVKASKILKELVVYGGIGAFNPIAAILTWLTVTVTKAKLTATEKTKILSDLKNELEITEEKIADATSAGDTKKKYELMRVRNEFKKSIEKIRNSPVAKPIG